MDSADSLLDLIVLADLTPGKPPSTTVERVDKDSLDEFLERSSPSVALGKFALTFEKFRDFRPERVAPQVPATTGFMRLRKELGDLMAGRGSVETLRKELEGRPDLARALEAPAPQTKPAPAPQTKPAPAPPPRPAPPPADDPTAGIFAMVDTGEAAPAAAPAEPGVGKFLEAVAGSSSGARPSTAALKDIAAKVDASLAESLVQVMHSAPFRDLEAAWRGLRLLVRSIDFRAGTRLHVISADRSEYPRLLQETVGPLAADLRTQGRLPCLILDERFDRSDDSLKRAESTAETAAAFLLPVVASFESDGDAEALRSIDGWKSLRARESTRWTTLVANRFLLRVPYGKDLDPVRDFGFEEPPDRPLWGNGSWIVGALLASSAARTGWETDMTGQEAAAGLESLPLRASTLRHGESIEIPLETDLSETAVRALGEAGLLALACRRNSDRVFAGTAAAVHEAPPKTPPASLRQALFTARIAMHLERLIAAIDPSADPADIARTLGAGLELLGMTDSGAAFSVDAKPADTGGRPAVSLRVRPQAGPLRGVPELQIDVPIPLR